MNYGETDLLQTTETKIDSKDAKTTQEIITIKGGKVYEFFKRTFDIIFSILSIILLSWLLLILALVVKMTSKGPAIFKDIRVGKNKKRIKVYKYRTMYFDSESNIDKYFNEEQKEIYSKERKVRDDPRVTKVGKFLRKTSLDELPQLFNILFGDLSFIGPRPVKMTELVDNYSEKQVEALMKVKPGLSGYWQVYGRSDVTYESGDRQKEELEYLSKRGLLFDLKLMILTIPAVLKHRGAQ